MPSFHSLKHLFMEWKTRLQKSPPAQMKVNLPTMWEKRSPHTAQLNPGLEMQN